MTNCSDPDLLSPKAQTGRQNRKPKHVFSKGNIYKDSVYVDLSHRGCPPLLVTCWVVSGSQSLVQRAGKERSWLRTSFP